MALLQSGTRIYGFANVDTQINVSSGNAVINATGFFVNNFVMASNSYVQTLTSVGYVSNTYLSSANISRTGTLTQSTANIIFSGYSTIVANNTGGNPGQILYSNGVGGMYWANASAGFTNGQSISVNTFQFTGQVLAANGYTGSVGVYLAGNTTGGVSWAIAPAQGPTGYTGSIGATTGYTGSPGSNYDLGINSQTTSYSLQSSDDGKFISTTAGVTVPSSIFNAGQSVSIYNNSSSSITITQGSGVTMYIVGTATTGNRTLAQRGFATVFCVNASSSTFIITGGGVS
jgi:hypothetical protein